MTKIKGLSEKLRIGDKVLVERTWLKTNFSSKLENKWTGPYFVHEIAGDNIYKLRTMEGQKVKNVVHGNRLKLYRERRMEPLLGNRSLDNHRISRDLGKENIFRTSPR